MLHLWILRIVKHIIFTDYYSIFQINENLNRSDKYVASSNLSIYYTWKNIKKLYKNNEFKISAPTYKEEFKLHDGSHSVSDAQDCFEYILKKHEAVTDNPSIMIYVNKIENRITFKIKKGYYLLIAVKARNGKLRYI